MLVIVFEELIVIDFSIRAERPADAQTIAAVQNAAFGKDKAIPALVADLRAMDQWPLKSQSLVAEVAGVLVGHVMLSHVHIDAPTQLIDALVLSPLGVHPDFQGQGCGTSLIKAAIQVAQQAGAPALFLEGSPGYYGQRGFSPAVELGFRRPSTRIPDKAFQVVTLKGFEPSMTGTMVYHDVHWRHGVGLYPRP